MESIDIREYLYHGICGTNAPDNLLNGDLYIFESMLKTGYIVNAVESKKYGVSSKCNVYADMGYSPRISLGFYPLDQETYSLSKKLHPNFYAKKITDKIIGDHNISYNDLDEFIMSCHNLNKGGSVDYAWSTYYSSGITLLLSKELLKDLKISNYGMLVDEICIDEPINLRKYLKYVAVNNDELLNMVVELLQKYNFDVPIIEFPSGLTVESQLEINKKITLKR